MKQTDGGSIVLFASIYGLVAPDPRIYKLPLKPNPIDYGVSKSGILQMMRYLAVHFAPDKVRVNCITPGSFPSSAFQENYPETTQAITERTPMGRFGKPDEIVGPALFLLSGSSSFITGHSLNVDGGWTAW
jgi:NAD(P)-dependent dehydrogenase (short-subunit alcohol dehydrogenase family)